MGSSGSGSSGKVDYPIHMKEMHQEFMGWTSTGVHDTLTTSITDAMEASIGNSPLTTMVAFDPDAKLAVVDTQVATLAALSFATKFDAYAYTLVPANEVFSPLSDLGSFLTAIKADIVSELYSTTEVDADIAAFGALLDDQIDSTVLPRFRRGMQNVNAVMSSAFTIGAALIEEGRNKEIVKYGTALRVQNYRDRNAQAVELLSKLLILKVQALTSDMDLAYRRAVSDLEFRRAVTGFYHDTTKTYIIAKKEEVEANFEITEKDGRWDLETYQYGANMLAAIGGGTAVPEAPKISKAASALGGAAAGASIGAAAGPYGAAAGAVIGAIAGLLSSS